MKKFFTTLIAIILVVAVGGAVFIFAFDKKIPTKWANSVIEAVKDDEFPSNDKLPKKLKYLAEYITYTKEGNKTVTTYDYKVSLEVTNKSTADAEAYVAKTTQYNEKGEVSEELTKRYYVEEGQHYREDKDGKTPLADFSEVYAGYGFSIAGFYEEDRTLDADIIVMINSNLEYVSQKGLNIILHLVDGNVSVNISFNIISKRVVKFERTEDTYTDNVLSHRVHEYVEF